METKPLITVSGECFKATLVRSSGSYDQDRTYEFRLEDLAASGETRVLIVVFTRPAIVNAHNFQLREHLLPWNAIRRAFDRGELSFDTWPKDKREEIKVRGADFLAAREPLPDDIIREYLMARLYWLGYRHRVYDNPVQTWVNLEADEDLD